jgi:hypothetical protein
LKLKHIETTKQALQMVPGNKKKTNLIKKPKLFFTHSLVPDSPKHGLKNQQFVGKDNLG